MIRRENSHSLGWALSLTVLGWGINARAQETPPTLVPRPASSEALGHVSELVAQGALDLADPFITSPFQGNFEGHGIDLHSVTLSRNSQLRILILHVAIPKGANPFEPGEMVLRDNGGAELGRFPAKLSPPRLVAGQSGLLVVTWTRILPKPPRVLEILDRNGRLSFHCEGGLE